MNTQTTVINGRIELYRMIDNEKCERVITSALLPTVMHADWEGQSLHLIDWRIAQDGKTVRLEYQTRNDAYAPVLYATLAVEVTRQALKAPSRSKAWQWQPFWSYWLNTKTGERVQP